MLNGHDVDSRDLDYLNDDYTCLPFDMHCKFGHYYMQPLGVLQPNISLQVC